jgi:hypothetical protein
MLVGVATGVVAGVFATLLVTARLRPDLAIALVLAVPSLLGLALLLVSASRWVTALGAFCLAVGPGWFAVLVLTEVVNHA